MSKVCSACINLKPQTSFVPNNAYADGHSTWCRDCHNSYNVQWNQENRQRRRNTHLKRTYGIDLNDYNRMFQIQGGHCSICKKHQSDLPKALVVDHNHETGKVRGLLCDFCNRRVLSILENFPEYLENANKYLEEQHG